MKPPIDFLADINVLVFDLGGVLVNIDPDRVFDEIDSHLAGSISIDQHLALRKLFKTYELGEISSILFLDQINNILGAQIPNLELTHIWNTLIFQGSELIYCINFAKIIPFAF